MVVEGKSDSLWEGVTVPLLAVKMEKKYRWLLGAECCLWLKAHKETRPQTYNHKELDSVNNLNKLGVDLPVECPSKSPVQPTFLFQNCEHLNWVETLVEPIWNCDPNYCEIINEYCFKFLILRWFVKQQWKTNILLSRYLSLFLVFRNWIVIYT